MNPPWRSNRYSVFSWRCLKFGVSVWWWVVVKGGGTVFLLLKPTIAVGKNPVSLGRIKIVFACSG
jgi:hypothetical protein